MQNPLKTNQKSYFQRILLGFKKAKSIPTLPDHIIKFQSNPLIRILRVLGGVSFITMISNSHLHLPIYILYVAMFFALIFSFYQFFILYHRTIQLIKVLKSNKLEVRNSPLDRLAYLAAKSLWCFKYGCDLAGPGIGVGLGLMISSDEILKGGGREPIFTPFLGGLLNKILPDNSTKDSDNILQNTINLVKANNSVVKTNKSFLDQLKDLNVEGDLTNDEFSEMQKLILENQYSLKNKNSELKSKIIELLDELEK